MGETKSRNYRQEQLMRISQQTQAARDVYNRLWISCAKMLTLKGNSARKSWTKRKEQEKQQETIQAMLQQQQMNQAFISVVEKLPEK